MWDSDQRQKKRNLRFLWASGSLYAEKNPQLSKYLISRFHRLSSTETGIDGQAASMLYCPHCFNLFRPGNHVARLSAKLRMSRRLARIKQKAIKYGIRNLSKQRARYLQYWENSHTKLSVRCNACHMTTKTPGSKRCIRQPQQEGRRKLAAKRRLQQQQQEEGGQQLSKGNIPATPRRDLSLKQNRNPFTTGIPQGSAASCSILTPGLSTVSARKARNLQRAKHQQLQRMLQGARHEKANTQSPLKDFLVSL